MRARVLVIDDEEAIRKSLRMVLEYEGYEFLEAASGPEGLETLRRENPDALLLDIKMPGMDGMEVLQAARTRDAHTPILMISGHGDIPTAVDALRKGAYDFLEKPLETERVLAALRNAIERKRLRDENLRLRHQVEARHARRRGGAPVGARSHRPRRPHLRHGAGHRRERHR
jgi:two-component system nitrogen regulation response regulator NtrX